MIGMRGLPADLPLGAGGERETEAQATRLAARGHDVTVYCRWDYNRNPQSPYLGVRLISLPSIPTKNFGTVTHSLLATLHTIVFNTADIVNFHGMGNGLFIPLTRLANKRCLMNMGGIDWERPKWGRAARLALRLGAWLSFRLADTVVVDNNASRDRLEAEFNGNARVIPLGAEPWEPPGSDTLEGRGLRPDGYLLFVGRLVPDKAVDVLLRAYRLLETEMPLVIVGDTMGDARYGKYLNQLADSRARFLGFVYGREVRQLFANCAVYVQPSAMEGNSPSLLSAMACARCTVVSDIGQNVETVGGTGLTFRSGDHVDLAKVLKAIISDPHRAIATGQAAKARVRAVFDWDLTVDQIESIYRGYLV